MNGPKFQEIERRSRVFPVLEVSASNLGSQIGYPECFYGFLQFRYRTLKLDHSPSILAT